MTTERTAGSRKAVDWTRTATTTDELVEAVTSGSGHVMVEMALATWGTATATATARRTTVRTALGHGTPCSMPSTGGGDAGREGARAGLAGDDWVASLVHDEEGIAAAD